MAYGPLVDDQTIKTKISKYWNQLKILRWALVTLVLVVCKDFSAQQIQVNLVLSLLWQALILIGRPYEDNRILMFNELTVTLYLYVLIMLTDYNDSVDTFDTLAIILLGIILVAFLVNLLVMAFNFLVFLVKGVKKLRLKFRNKEASSD